MATKQEEFNRDKIAGIKHIIEEVLDKEILMKPIRLRAAIVEQAVLQGYKNGEQVDIDEALEEYDKFLEKKLK